LVTYKCTTKFVKHPMFRGIEPLQVLLQSSSLSCVTKPSTIIPKTHRPGLWKTQTSSNSVKANHFASLSSAAASNTLVWTGLKRRKNPINSMNGVLIGSHVYPGQIITVIGPIIPWTLVWARLFSFGKCQNDKTEIPQIPKQQS